MPAFPDLKDRLSDGDIELRAAGEWDIPDILIAHQDDPDLHRRLGLRRPPSGAELGRAAERAPDDWAAGSRLELTVVEPGDETCRGRVLVHDVDWSERRAELGIWLVPQRRGRGLASRVLRLAAGWLLGAAGLERLLVIADSDNQPMLRAAQTAGFVRDPSHAPDRVALTLSAAARPAPGPPTA